MKDTGIPLCLHPHAFTSKKKNISFGIKGFKTGERNEHIRSICTISHLNTDGTISVKMLIKHIE